MRLCLAQRLCGNWAVAHQIVDRCHLSGMHPTERGQARGPCPYRIAVISEPGAFVFVGAGPRPRPFNRTSIPFIKTTVRLGKGMHGDLSLDRILILWQGYRVTPIR